MDNSSPALMERTRALVAMRVFPLILAGERLDSYRMNDSYDDDEIAEFTDQSWDHAVLVAMYEAIQSPLCNTHDKSLIALFDIMNFAKGDWVQSLQVCVGRQIEGLVHQRCTPVGHVTVHACNSSHATLTVTEFQEYTIQRIKVHANRVASCGLAAAKLVQNEIETTMTKVWKEIPDRKDWDRSGAQSGKLRDDLAQSDRDGLIEDYDLNGLFLLD